MDVSSSSALLWSRLVRRPSFVLTFHIFHFSSETAEWNSTKLDRKQDLNVLYHVCVFRADKKKQDGYPASDWLKHFLPLLWNRWTELNETWHETISQRPLPSLCFSGRSEKKIATPATDELRHCRLLLWISAERNSKELDRTQDFNVLYQSCVFQAHQKKII